MCNVTARGVSRDAAMSGNAAFLLMWPIIIIGVRIDHFANVRPTIPKCFIFGLGRPAARSSQSLYLADCIAFTGAPHDGLYFCALQPCLVGQALYSTPIWRRPTLYQSVTPDHAPLSQNRSGAPYSKDTLGDDLRTVR